MCVYVCVQVWVGVHAAMCVCSILALCMCAQSCVLYWHCVRVHNLVFYIGTVYVCTILLACVCPDNHACLCVCVCECVCVSVCAFHYALYDYVY